MKKILKVIIGLFLGLFLVGVASVLLVPRLVDLEKYQPEVEQKLSELVGVPVSFGNDLHLSFFPWFGLEVSDIRIANPDGYTDTHLLDLGSFQAHLKVMPLFSKKVEVDRVILDAPQISLEKLGDGRANWMISAPAGTEDKKEETSPGEKGDFQLESFQVAEVLIREGAVTYRDGGTKKEHRITGITLRLADVSLDRPLLVDFAAMVDNQPVSLGGSIGPIGKNPGKGELLFDLVIKAADTLQLNLNGNIKNAVTEPSFSLAMAIDRFSPRDLASRVGVELPVEPSDPEALSGFEIAMEVTGSPDHAKIENGRLGLDTSTFEFSGQMTSFSPPSLQFKGTLDTLDLDRYLPEAGNDNEAKKQEENPDSGQVAEIDYAPLRNLFLDIVFDIDQLKVHGGQVENVTTHITGKDGIFRLEPLALDLYNGGVEIAVEMNVQGTKPVTVVQMNGTDITVGPLLNDFMQKDFLEGLFESTVSLTFSGDTPDEIKKSLSGEGALMFRDGAIVGVDLAGMVRNIQAAFGAEATGEKPRTDFAELTIPFTLEKGLFASPGMVLKSPLLRVNVMGTADLVSEQLNMKVHPKFVATLVGQGDTVDRSGIMIPVIVSGVFTAPEFSPDVEAMVQGRVEEEIDKVLEKQGVPKDLVPEGMKDVTKGLRSLLPKF